MKIRLPSAIFSIVLVATLLTIGPLHFVLDADSMPQMTHHSELPGMRLLADICCFIACLTFVMLFLPFVVLPTQMNSKVHPPVVSRSMIDLPHLDPPPRCRLMMIA